MTTKLKAQAKAITKSTVQPKGRSNAQRQADYRKRHLSDENGQLERLSLLVDLHTKRALKRLASCYGVTQKTALERLVIQADLMTQEAAAETAPDGQADYFDGRIRLQWQGVT